MADFGRIIAREMAKSNGGVKVIHGRITSKITPDIEWLKWLAYEPEFLEKRMNFLTSNLASELSKDELKGLVKYVENKKMLILFRKYGTESCSKEEYLKVYDYMRSESIENLMFSKLSSDELNMAKLKIQTYFNMSQEELNDVVRKQERREEYNSLSMVDSFVFHEIAKINFRKNMKKLNTEINSQIEQNELMRQRSMVLSRRNVL